MRVARVCARHALLPLFVCLALAPTSVLAFNPPDPNNPGHHYGEYLHNKHLQSQKAPLPGPGRGGTGVQNALVRTAGNPVELPALQFEPSNLSLPALIAANSVGKDALLVVIVLAALIAANVVLGVIYLSRGWSYIFTRALRPVPATA